MDETTRESIGFGCSHARKLREIAGGPIMKIWNIYFSIAALVIAGVVAGTVAAQDGNSIIEYYTQPSDGSDAARYVAPHPVPANVGISYYTYQPLMPQEFLYRHSRTYWTAGSNSPDACGDSNGGALTRTSIRWQSTGYHMGNLPSCGKAFERCRYKWATRRYNASQQNGGGQCVTGDGGNSGCVNGGSSTTGFTMSDTIVATPSNDNNRFVSGR